ncbi:MAG: TonB-dependent receptor [bacterium]|nr:TonB-dependent receptor [bacterium]
MARLVAAGLCVAALACPLPTAAAATAAPTASPTAGLPDTLTWAPEVVVTASRYGAGVRLSQQDITAAELRDRLGAADLPLLLEDTPGLHATSDAGNGVGYTYLNIRGFDQKRVGVMINGIPLNDPEDHQVYWVDVPDLAASLEDVQVQRGITNSLGATTAVGGTVNLVTEQFDDEAGGRVAVQGGSFGTWRGSAAWQTGPVGDGFSSAVRWSRIVSDGYRDRTGSRLWGAFWSGRWLGERHSLQANVYTGHEVSKHGWNAAAEADLLIDRRSNPETYPHAVDDFRQPHYELHHRWTLSDRVTLVQAAYLIHGEGFYENLKEGVTAGDYSLDHSLGIGADDEVDLVRRKLVDKDQLGWVPHLEIRHAGGRTILGGDLYDFHSDHHGDVLSVAGVADGLQGVDYYRYTGDKQAQSVFVNTMFEAAPGLTLIADLQLQHKRYVFRQAELGNFTGEDRHAYEVSYDWFNPKGGVHWELPARPWGGRAAAYLHVGVTRREPTDGELYDTWYGPDDLGVAPLFRTGRGVDEDGDGDTDYVQWSDPYVREEKAVDWELGWSWRAERLSWTLNGYWMDFTDEIVPYGAVDDEGAAIRGNAERTLHRGLELGLAARLADRHELRVAASRSWDEFDAYVATLDPDSWESGSFDYSGNPIPLFPRHLASITLASDFGALDTRLRLRSVGRQHLDATGRGERTIDGYATLDVSAGLDLADLASGLRGARFSLDVRNLLDEEYETNGYWYGGRYLIPAAGRSFQSGVRYDF